MLVIVVNNVPPALRGRLALWFLEIRAGVYVGRASARHRERAWSEIEQFLGMGDAVMIEPDANAEQGFAVRTAGENRRIPEDWEGLIESAFLPEPADPDGQRKPHRNDLSKSVAWDQPIS